MIFYYFLRKRRSWATSEKNQTNKQTNKQKRMETLETGTRLVDQWKTEKWTLETKLRLADRLIIVVCQYKQQLPSI